MKKIISMLTIVLALVSCSSSKNSESDSEKSAEKVAEQLTYQRAAKAIENWQFVLEADRSNVNGRRQAFVNSNTNFVMVDGDNGSVQIASNGTNPGLNNMGGITVDGTISAKSIKTDKKGNVFCTFSITGVGISAQISIRLYANSDNANLTVCPNFSNRDLNFSGRIVPLAQSNVFKGRSI